MISTHEQHHQQQLRNANDEALTLLEQGFCGAAFGKWRQILREIREPGSSPLQQQQEPITCSQEGNPNALHAIQISSIPMHPSKIASINSKVCPDVSFPMFCRAFTIGSKMMQDPSSSSSSGCSATEFQVSRAMDAAVVLYNLGFAYQVAGLSSEASLRANRLEQARDFYSLAERSLSDIFRQGLPGFDRCPSYSALIMLAIAIYINQGHIHAYRWQLHDLQHCQKRISVMHGILQRLRSRRTTSSSSSVYLLTQEEDRYVENIVFETIMVLRIPNAAPIA